MFKKNPRILHAYKSYYPDEGGIPTVIKLITEGLQDQAYQEVLSATPGLCKKKDIVNKVQVHRMPSFGEVLSLPIAPTYPFAFWKKAGQFDIVDYHFPMPWIDVSVACYFPKQTKLVVHWHSDIVRQKRTGQLLGPAIDRCLARADKIIVANEAILPPRLAQYRDKCAVIPFGIEVNQWQKINPIEQNRIDHYRKQYKNFILGVGRLVPYKGFATLIDAMQNVDAQLVIVGQGPLEEELKNQIQKLNLTDRVHLVGKVNNSELKSLYYAAEIFAFPSITENETFGMVQLEAMACGKAIVNTSLQSGVPAVARHQQEALTVTPGNAQELSQALTTLLTNDELRNKLAANSVARVNSEYTIERFLERMMAVYEELHTNKKS
jgi:rhamnosyl/mannosyltransferase